MPPNDPRTIAAFVLRMVNDPCSIVGHDLVAIARQPILLVRSDEGCKPNKSEMANMHCSYAMYKTSKTPIKPNLAK
jgi:hypothetical protein